VRHSTFACITNVTIESIGTNDLPSVAKKVVVARMAGSSTEAFPTVGLALQLEVSTMAIASIPGPNVGEEC
jgi:NCAIR mutase (PurE)-related protein